MIITTPKMATYQLQKIEIDSVQRNIIKDFGDIISKEINLSVTVVKGFLWKALREWQNVHGISVLDTEKNSGSSPKERVKQAKQILSIFRNYFLESAEIDDKQLDFGISKSIRHYLGHYANR